MSERKEPMVHVNVRLPRYVLEHFKQYPNYTRKMREVLIERVREEIALSAFLLLLFKENED